MPWKTGASKHCINTTTLKRKQLQHEAQTMRRTRLSIRHWSRRYAQPPAACQQCCPWRGMLCTVSTYHARASSAHARLW